MTLLLCGQCGATLGSTRGRTQHEKACQPARDRAIVEAYAETQSLRVVAAEFDVSPGTVRKVVDRSEAVALAARGSGGGRRPRRFVLKSLGLPGQPHPTWHRRCAVCLEVLAQDMEPGEIDRVHALDCPGSEGRSLTRRDESVA